jgi:ATP:ADP antiporter, AAA family
MNRIVRTLHSFVPVEKGELMVAALMAVNVFVLLTIYYVLKVVREPLILLGGGAELKAYASAGQALLLLGVVPAFSWLAARTNRFGLLATIQTFFIGCLIAFYVLAHAKAPIGLAFYLWVGIFNVLVVSNFWSFATDLYSQEQGKRLFGIIGLGGSVGAIVGAFLPKLLAHVLGVYQLMLFAAVGLALSTLVYWIIDRHARRERDHGEVIVHPHVADATHTKEGGFKLVFEDRYLRLVAAMVVIGTVVNTTGEFVVGTLVEHSAKGDWWLALVDPKNFGHPLPDAGEVIEQFYSTYYFAVNVVSAVIQGLIVSKILGVAGVRRALFIMPFVVLGSWVTFLSFATLATIRITKTTENSLDYSLNNTVRQALFLPTTRDVKYKAKAAIDSFFVRGADMLSGLGIVFVLAEVLHIGVHGFAIVNICLTIGWLFIARRTGQLYDYRASHLPEEP